MVSFKSQQRLKRPDGTLFRPRGLDLLFTGYPVCSILINGLMRLARRVVARGVFLLLSRQANCSICYTSFGLTGLGFR